MKYPIYILLILISLTHCASPKLQDLPMSNLNDLQSLWTEIDSLEKEGLFSSALEKLDSLQIKAAEIDAKDHIVKALFYKAKYSSNLKEDSAESTIQEFELALQNESDLNYKRIYHSILGELYYNYASQNQYKFNQRTKLETTAEGIAAWSIEDIVRKSNTHFKSSVQDLQTDDLELDNHKLLLTSYILKDPSFDLYSLLLMRAIKHFQNDRNLISEPVYAFRLTNENVFSTIDDFVELDFNTEDNESYQALTLQLYQKLLAYHIGSAVLDRLNVERLDYVRSIHSSEQKDSLYQEAVRKLSESSNYAKFAYARTLFDHTDNSNNRKAHELITNLINSELNTELRQNVSSFLNSMEAPSLSVTVEQVYLPNEAALFQLSFNNVDQITFDIKKIDARMLEKIRNEKNRDQQLKAIQDISSEVSWIQDIPDSDFSSLSSELLMPALPIGQYLLLASSEQLISYNVFQVSNLSYSTINSSEGLNIIVAERKTGVPKENVLVTFYENDYRKGKNKIGEARSDSNGRVTYDFPQKNQNYHRTTIKLEQENDILEFRDMYSQIRYQPTNQSRMYTFSDRNIYRPNQRVYIKAILLENDSDVIKNAEVEIRVQDPNGREVYKTEQVTNEYGSISADFLLPDEGVTGNFHIQLSSKRSQTHGYLNFQVEEYKRPSFEIEIDKPEVEYSLGDSLTLTGRTMMYSGPQVSDAKIEYRITRNQYHYDNWYNYRRGGSGNTSAEIDFGQIKSDANGDFKLTFKLKESSQSNFNRHSVFLFNVEIKATDITGETQYFTEQVKVSRKKTFISTNLRDEIKLSDLDSIRIFSKNINDLNVAFQGKVVIESLMAPVTFKRHKYWTSLDTTMLSDADYAQVPLDYKMNGFDFDNWSVENEIYSDEFVSASGDYKLSLTNQNQNVYYKLSIKNNETNEVEYEKVFKIIDLEKSYLDKQKIFNYNVNKANYQPGDQIELRLASANRDVNVYYQLEKQDKLVNSDWHILTKDVDLIKIAVHENDRGGFYIHLISFYENRVQQERIKINVPHTDKKLQIKLHSFKTVVDVGSSEEWTISIEDHLGVNVTAEVLASMYDVSLDALSSEHMWQEINYSDYYSRLQFITPGYRIVNGNFLKYFQRKQTESSSGHSYYPDLNRFGYYGTNQQFMRTAGRRNMKSSAPRTEAMEMDTAGSAEAYQDGNVNTTSVADTENIESKTKIDWSNVRDVLDETVFFYPDLITDQNGETVLKFKMSDALSSWKLQIFAHDKDGRYALETHTLNSIREIAVYPNFPRFLRVDDQLSLSGKVVNSSDKSVNTEVTIQFLNPDTNEDVTSQVVTSKSSFNQRIDPNSSSEISWTINVIPQHLSGLMYRIHAGHKNGGDAIEGFIPVTTNQILITESLPIYVKGGQEKELTFNSISKVLASDDALLHKYVLEYTSNPSWYVIQALPYLSNPTFKSSVNVLNKYFANCIGKSIAAKRPELKSTLESWNRTNSNELKSNLEKNQDLKTEKIINTPWLRQSLSEAEQKSEIIKFFSENTIDSQLNSSLTELSTRQNSDGGFSWIPGGKSNIYITTLILENIGRLNQLHIQHDIPKRLIENAVDYIDNKIADAVKNDIKKRSFTATHLQVLYARSYFIRDKKISPAFKTLLEKINKNWVGRELYEQAMLASILHRVSDEENATKIMKSLQEQMIVSEDKGAYWKRNRSYYSNHSTIDKHVMMIELFHEMGVSQDMIDDLRIWLLRNKQTNHWKTSKSTSAAVYAFLLNGQESESDWVKDTKPSVITVAGEVIESKKEVGSFYSRHDFDPATVSSKSANINIENPNKQSGWGSAYVQYYDDIKNVENNSLSELSIKKEILKKTMSPTGPVLESIINKTLVPGDKLVVRLVLENDRSLEYVHVKDERASGLEPVNILSGFKYRDALQYYEVTRDDSSNFYMSRLPRGIHVFEYELTVNLNGEYSSGMATAQCIYAPEFIAHSNSIQLQIKS